MAKRRLTQPERRARTRRKLLDSAMQLFAKRGFDGTTVEDIANRAGYSTGALYAHFGGKDELLFAIFDEHVAWIWDMLREIDLDRSDEAVAADVLAMLNANPEQMLVFIEFWAYAVREPKARRRFAGRLAEIRTVIEEAIRSRLEGRGEPPALAAGDLALVLIALGRGLALEAIADPGMRSQELYGAVVRRLLGAPAPV